jgi:membrane-bound metal-dependent hydrolase YbcI (DUF457 family)
MMGRTHALSGLVVGVAAGQFVWHLNPAHLAVAAAVTAGATVLPDIDHPDATCAREFGFVTEAFAWVVEHISGGHRALTIGGHFADLLAIAGAAAMLYYGYAVALVPWAIAAGTATHLVGDMLTNQGIPIAWPLSRQHIRLLPEPLAFTTGTRPERWVVAPLLLVALVWLVGVVEKVLPAGRLPLR